MFSRDLVASVATRFLAAAWINGRDIVYGRDLVSLVFLKNLCRDHNFRVATSLSFSSSGFQVTTSVLGCNPISVYKLISGCDFLFLVATLLVVFCLHRFQL